MSSFVSATHRANSCLAKLSGVSKRCDSLIAKGQSYCNSVRILCERRIVSVHSDTSQRGNDGIVFNIKVAARLATENQPVVEEIIDTARSSRKNKNDLE